MAEPRRYRPGDNKPLGKARVADGSPYPAEAYLETDEDFACNMWVGK